MRAVSVTLAALTLAVLAQPAFAQEEGNPLAKALAKLRDAPRTERQKVLAEVLSGKPTVIELMRAADAGLPSPAATLGGWSVLDAEDDKGKKRPYHLYVPEKVAESGTPAPLLLDIHGGVSRQEFIPAEQFARFRTSWVELADEHGFVLALPLGRADCMWWAPAGVDHVLATVRDTRRHAPIDPDRIFATGFSDGGSGAWFYAMAVPDPFAGLLPMNGHPGVAIGSSGRQLYPSNARQTPLFVCMTQDDGLYPGKSVLPHVQALFDLGANVHLVSYPVGGHRPVYFEDQSPAFASFLNETERNPLPDSLAWKTSSPDVGAVRWVEITAIGASAGDVAPDPEPEVTTRPGRVRVGFQIQQRREEPGVGVDAVVPDTLAATMGLAAGDVIVAIDGRETLDTSALRAVLGAKKHGDEVRLTVQREGAAEPLELSGRFPTFTPAPSYPRPDPTASVHVERSGNTVTIQSANVRTLRLLLSPKQFDLRKEVVVVANGKEIARKVPEVSVERMLLRFADEADERRLFPADLEVALPPAEDE